MKLIIEYMDELFNIYGSQYAVAKELGITRKRSSVKGETAFKIIKLLDVDELEILLAAESEGWNG